MGWWEHGPNGHSGVRSSDDDNNLLMWGDGPADIVDNALYAIKIAFLQDLGRMPSKQEIIAGLKFSTAVLDELADEPKDAPHANENQHHAVTVHGYAATGNHVGRSEREIEASKALRPILDALAVEMEPEVETEDLPKPGPVWTAVFYEFHEQKRLPFDSYDDALAYLGHNWTGGVLSPENLIYPDGRYMERDTLRKILASRAEI